MTRVSNVVQFNLEVQDFIDKLVPDQFAIFMRKVTLDMLGRIVLRTPVDTGHCRLNWQVGTVTNEDELPRDGADTGVVFADARAAVDALQGKAAYAIVYIFNNTPYVVYLEEGWSKQAPSGFVGVTVEEFRTLLQKAGV